MKKNRVMMLVAGALALGLALGGYGIANAASGTTPQTVPATVPNAMMGGTSPVVTLANLSGLSVPEIMALRAQGKSLATIATENGIDPATVVDQTIAARKTYLDSLVASGKIRAAQEQAILDKIEAGINAMMNAVPGTPQSSKASPTMSVTSQSRPSPAVGTVPPGAQTPKATPRVTTPNDGYHRARCDWATGTGTRDGCCNQR